MIYVGQVNGKVTALKGENAEFLFTNKDYALAESAARDDASNENVEKTVERLVDIAKLSGHIDPHSALFYLDRINQSHHGSMRSHADDLIEAGLDRAQNYPEVSARFLMAASGMPFDSEL